MSTHSWSVITRPQRSIYGDDEDVEGDVYHCLVKMVSLVLSVCVSGQSHLLCVSLKWSLFSLVSSISAVSVQACLISVCQINVFMLHPPPRPHQLYLFCFLMTKEINL